MQPLAASLTDKFLPVFRSLPDPVQLTGKTADALTIEQDGSVRVIRAPIGYVPPCPVIAIVGITPGRFQAEKALAAFRTALTCGRDIEAALQRAKGIAAFSGPLRANLVAMLDYIELHHALGVSSCADLFGAASDPVHFTSALPYPVFVGDANYSGMPDFLRFPMLRRWIETALAEEANALPSAVCDAPTRRVIVSTRSCTHKPGEHRVPSVQLDS